MKSVSGRQGVLILVGISLVASAGALACHDAGKPAGSPQSGDAAAEGGDAAAPVVVAPDLRFKWVGAGFTLRVASLLSKPSTFHGPEFWSAVPLVGEGGDSPLFTFKTAENLESMSALATEGELARIQSEVVALPDGRAMYTSLDSGYSAIDRGYVFNGIAIGTDSGSTKYLPFTRATLPPDGIAAWASEQGARGVVVTALCPQASDADGGRPDGAFGGADAGGGAGSIYATGYGRQRDTSTYETQVAIAPFATLGAQLDAMAAGGYIVTALGRDGTGKDGAGNFIAVGTRVTGQTIPRAIKVIDVPCIAGSGDIGVSALGALFADGYALVGEIFHGTSECNGNGTWAFIGER